MHTIKEAQARLKALGYYGADVDGIAGRLTREALKSFQTRHGLEVDGKYGPKTDRALFGLDAQPAVKPEAGGLEAVDREYLLAEAKDSLFAKRYRQAQVDGLNLIVATFEQLHPAGSLDWLAYILATAFHETGPRSDPLHMTPRSEKYNPPEDMYFRRYDPPNRVATMLGNVQTGDGLRFKGRGYVQITGRRNYGLAAGKLGLPLLQNPGMVMDPPVAAVVLVRGMAEGWFTGRKLSDYDFTVNDGAWERAREIVNGDDDAALIGGYGRAFARALRRGISGAVA